MPDESLKVIGKISMHKSEELYKLVNFLNKNLKDRNIIFGLSMENEKMNIIIYEA